MKTGERVRDGARAKLHVMSYVKPEAELGVRVSASADKARALSASERARRKTAARREV